MWRALVEPLVTPGVGWLNRFYVFFGTAVILLPGSRFQMMIYVAAWGGFTYQVVLSTVYHRGQRHAAQEITFGLQPGGDVRQALELGINEKLVALDDLAIVCGRYGIPPEEMRPIIERGFGMRFVKGDDG